MIKKMHVLSVLFLFLVLLFAGCQEDSNAPTDPIDNSGSTDQSLSKYGGSDDGYYERD